MPDMEENQKERLGYVTDRIFERVRALVNALRATLCKGKINGYILTPPSSPGSNPFQALISWNLHDLVSGAKQDERFEGMKDPRQRIAEKAFYDSIRR